MSNTQHKSNSVTLPLIKVFVSNPQSSIEKEVAWLPQPCEVVDSVDKCNLVLFTGGCDVNPDFYGEEANSFTNFSIERDASDLTIFKMARAMLKPMVGVCRGAQFLCVQAGGKLVQHQANNGAHKIRTFTNQEFLVTSDHHQAQHPWNLDKDEWELLSWTLAVSGYHKGAYSEMVVGKAHLYPNYGFPPNLYNLPEIEDAYYYTINALAIQCHPEWMQDSGEICPSYTAALQYYKSLVLRLLMGFHCPEGPVG